MTYFVVLAICMQSSSTDHFVHMGFAGTEPLLQIANLM